LDEVLAMCKFWFNEYMKYDYIEQTGFFLHCYMKLTIFVVIFAYSKELKHLALV